jgi:predicted DNA-binding mobile mystery protein A
MAIPRTLLSASQTDRKLPVLRDAARTLASMTPATGWIGLLRSSLGMTTAALARRLRIAQQNVVKLENSERAGTVTLASLRRAADALDADLVYAIVPRKNLRDTISARAREIAEKRIVPVAHTMRLEAQGLSDEQIEEQIEELARDLERRPRELWR